MADSPYQPSTTELPNRKPFEQGTAFEAAVFNKHHRKDTCTIVALGVAVAVLAVALVGVVAYVATTPDTCSELACPYLIYPSSFTNWEWTCPDQSLTLEERRTLPQFEPFNEINGLVMETLQPASAAFPIPFSNRSTYWYQNVTYLVYKIGRPAGLRAPIHYHEVPQEICLEKGKITVYEEGSDPVNYTAPDCYLMHAFRKMSVLTLEDKVEICPFRVPDGGYDWIVLEEQYYDQQGQWQEDEQSAQVSS